MHHPGKLGKRLIPTVHHWWEWFGTGGIGTQLIVGGVIVLIIIFGVFGVRLGRATGRVIRALDGARVRAERAGDRRAFPQAFDALDQDLKGAPIVGAPWRRFESTLLVPAEPSQPVQQTVAAERFFDSGLLRGAGLNTRFHAALPNVLVGGGLLLTFIGLIIALSSAANIGSDRIEESQKALHGLLQAASLKFISSLVGLSLSIAYLLLHKFCLHRIDVAADRFCAVLAERMPQVSPHSLARESNRLLNEQLGAQQLLVTDLAMAIGERLDDSFGRRLAEQIEPLRGAIERMADGMATMNQGAIEQMIERFGQLMRDTAGGELRQLAGTLGGMSEGLKTLTSGFATIQEELRASGSAAAAELAATIRGAAQEMQAASEASRIALRETSERMAEGSQAAIGTIAELLTKLEGGLEAAGAALALQTKAAEQAATTFAPAAAALERAAGQAAAAIKPLPELTLALASLHAALQGATSAQTEAHRRTADLVQTLSESLRRFEGLDRQLGGVFTQLEGGLMKIQQQVVRFAGEVDTATERAVRSLAGAIDNLQEVLEAAAPAVVRRG
jgi:hypothetical protein